MPFMLPGDSHVQARLRPRWPNVLVCSGLKVFPGLGTFSARIGTGQANRDETHCFAGRHPWIWHGEHPGDPHFLTEASFHVSRPVVEGTKLGELELRSELSLLEGIPNLRSTHTFGCGSRVPSWPDWCARYCFDSCMWTFAGREAAHILGTHNFVFSLWGVISKAHSLLTGLWPPGVYNLLAFYLLIASFLTAASGSPLFGRASVLCRWEPYP